jgi:hypothetical protein
MRLLKFAASNKVEIGIALVSAVMVFVARAPTSLEKVSIPIVDVELAVNAGYVLIFGATIITIAGVLLQAFSEPNSEVMPDYTEKRLLSILYVAPVLCAAFLSLQFFLLFAPPGECNTFDRTQLLTGFAKPAFQPEYCMGLTDHQQKHMPWLLNPPALNGWIQIAATLTAAWSFRAAWRKRFPGDEIFESRGADHKDDRTAPPRG